MLEITGPRLTAADPRGEGYSMTAAAAVTIARGSDLTEALRLATAAGALNATRHGLETGHRDEIEELVSRMRVAEIRAAD